jgi:hypothetical protein
MLGISKQTLGRAHGALSASDEHAPCRRALQALLDEIETLEHVVWDRPQLVLVIGDRSWVLTADGGLHAELTEMQLRLAGALIEGAQSRVIAAIGPASQPRLPPPPEEQSCP